MTIISWLLLGLVAAPLVAQWQPSAVADDSTIEFLTVAPDEGEHWSTVWFVVLDGDLYFRLGPRAVRRIDANTTAPLTKVRTSSGEVIPMRYEKAPDAAERVHAAMAAKHWSDILGEPFRKLGLTSPPVMLRLVRVAD